MTRLFCFGLGFSADALARRLAEKGWQIAGTARDQAKVERLKARGYEMACFAGEPRNDELAQLLRGTTHLLLSIPPRGEGDPALLHYRHTLASLTSLEWIGYLSTVGVYGDQGGAWVDETTPVAPNSARAQARVAAEAAWLDFGKEIGGKLQVFRLAGIYGKGRSAFDKLADGTARRIDKPGQVFNRIHVADIASVLQASMGRPRAGAIYNLADDQPAPPDEVVTYAAELLGVAPPPEVRFEDADLSPMARSFYAGSRRISNALIKSELGVVLKYPTYREGLGAIRTSLKEKD